MYILSFKTGHDPAACLVKDGELIAAVEEERFVRVKHAPGYPPWNSIKYCLDYAGISLDEVDEIVFARQKFPRTALTVLQNYLQHPPLGSGMELRYALSHMATQRTGLKAHIRGRAPYQAIFKVFNGHPRRVHAFDHHLCHAASAYRVSGFDDAAILTMDGKGEATSAWMGYGKAGGIRELRRINMPHSLGYLYASFTLFLGFEPNEGEYKVMGLAAYGKPILDLARVIRLKKGRYEVEPRYCLWPYSLEPLSSLFGAPRQPESEITERYRNLAASIQKALEDAALDLVAWLVQETGLKKICLAGGVALNVKMNKVIRESGLIEDIFVQPAAGDAGNVIGAAYELYHRLGYRNDFVLQHLYLGPEFSDDEIEAELKRQDLQYEYRKDITEVTAGLIARGNIVGWFQGRMEFGPRALGNRSILADPRDARVKDIVNAKVKFREPFRPFTPSILAERAADYLQHPCSAPFMIMSFGAKPERASEIPAVVHVDGTVRPQTVDRKTNPRYHRLLTAFEAVAGVPVLLNTSFNVRGEPVVCTPRDALSTFAKAHLDYLAIGNFLLSRPYGKI